ncbi:exodeoxyribonuclease III [Candidatus Nesciobacter abundans]|uniref:Endonuclease/exonuclease/phosphatase domain-containing protein n=1 Tax=Candidatus Nesciobacter abundans TaxID=2601668 RepID=A0A5C0UHS8_9PROT|nr:exodeoxyribonuclease III [Candidatus Nesciobacter abundans]QEK39307.1 hypothetical protein FZC36_02650 [Candidatus Nesciobacter abundans]
MNKIKSLKVASWNVNSVRVRAPLIEKLIKEEDPDVILLQETKCVDADFPREFFQDRSYEHLYISGQKSYNGVAIISKIKADSYSTDLKNNTGSEARYIEAEISGLRIASAYVPCGNKSDEAYEYKKEFLSNINTQMKGSKFIVGGDFNVAINDLDIQTPKKWEGSVLCRDDVREKMHDLQKSNFIDHAKTLEEMYDPSKSINKENSNTKSRDSKMPFTWWDYRRPNEGLRIDYIFTSEMNNECNLETLAEYRWLERPSDHVPLLLEIKL